MHQYHHLFNFLKNRELDELYACISLKSLGRGMINIFIPIYLYKIGFSLSMIFIFFALISLFHAAGAFPAGKLAAKVGFKHAILMSIPLLIIAYVFLYTIETYNWPLIIPAGLIGIHNAIFWTSYHIDFSKWSKSKDRGKSVGFAGMLVYLFAVGGPFIGGLILATLGFNILFIIVSLILISSAIPLFFTHDYYESTDIKLSHVFQHSKKDFLSFFGHGVETGVGEVLWPLFIFISIKESFTLLGSVASLSLLFSAGVVLLIGFVADFRRRLILSLGSVFHGMVWISKMFIGTPAGLFTTDALHGITKSMSHTPYAAIIYDKSNQTNRIEFLVAREVTFHLSRTAFLIAMVFIADLYIGFMIGSFTSLLYMLI